ncbi:hypothetical protein RclHR1_12120004 [Rhizophagus clarus]|uniref:Phosphatidylglycerol/phosphatidylinositol transfer protein n=1 Tax=Rhizophagus clarus TaxID=94130 RepID=A0A2Z6Q6C4_9GLOM|nr:hypothetical protein RclHR1_12120004 [Rhizophagus clarus]GES83273.1 hypothetical protein GLOIN_2v1491606 [Rhizophagus clarus]
MRQNFAYLFILLATISMINAIPLDKRATAFVACNNAANPSVLTVTINPDPPTAGASLTINASGTATNPITQGATINAVFIDANNNILGQASIQDFCSQAGISCPVQPGQTFTIPPIMITAPASLTNTALGVNVADTNSNPVACAVARFT